MQTEILPVGLDRLTADVDRAAGASGTEERNKREMSDRYIQGEDVLYMNLAKAIYPDMKPENAIKRGEDDMIREATGVINSLRVELAISKRREALLTVALDALADVVKEA